MHPFPCRLLCAACLAVTTTMVTASTITVDVRVHMLHIPGAPVYDALRHPDYVKDIQQRFTDISRIYQPCRVTFRVEAIVERTVSPPTSETVSAWWQSTNNQTWGISSACGPTGLDLFVVRTLSVADPHLRSRPYPPTVPLLLILTS